MFPYHTALFLRAQFTHCSMPPVHSFSMSLLVVAYTVGQVRPSSRQLNRAHLRSPCEPCAGVVFRGSQNCPALGAMGRWSVSHHCKVHRYLCWGGSMCDFDSQSRIDYLSGALLFQWLSQSSGCHKTVYGIRARKIRISGVSGGC